MLLIMSTKPLSGTYNMYNSYAVIDKRGFEPDGWTIHTEQDFNLFFAVVLR